MKLCLLGHDRMARLELCHSERSPNGDGSQRLWIRYRDADRSLLELNNRPSPDVQSVRTELVIAQ